MSSRVRVQQKICTELVSLSTGQPAELGKFCKSGYAEDDKCDEIIIKINNEEIFEPYLCEIGQACDYHLSLPNSKAHLAGTPKKYSYNCPCNGDPDSTMNHCFFSVFTKGEHEYLYERLQFDSSKCSGAVTHVPGGDGAMECGHYE